MQATRPKPRPAEQGFMLLGLIVAIFLILLVLGVAAPRLAKSLRRDREVEAVQRGKQYVRAIQLYYRKTGHYPGSIDQLEKTNNVRFLRQRYVDPLNTDSSGKSDWRLIHVGEAKTTVKGFFGQPLAGMPGAAGGLGSAAGMVSAGPAGAGAAGTGTSTPSSTFGSSGASQTGTGSTFGGSSTFGSSPGTSSTTGSQTGSGSSFGSMSGSSTTPGTGSNSSGISSQSATSFTGTGAPIVGVGSSAPGDSILVLNEQKTYPTWEFLYDPRIEQMKAKSAMLGGPASTGTSGFGSSATSPGLNGTTMPGGNTTPTTPPATGTSITPPQ